MFRKVTLALAAAATLGAIALSPTAASAKPPLIWNPNPHFHHHHWNPGVEKPARQPPSTAEKIDSGCGE